MYIVKLIYFTPSLLNSLTANGDKRRMYLHHDRPLLGHLTYISSFEDPGHQRSQLVKYHQQQQNRHIDSRYAINMSLLFSSSESYSAALALIQSIPIRKNNRNPQFFNQI